jgi:hypothetical protein
VLATPNLVLIFSNVFKLTNEVDASSNVAAKVDNPLDINMAQGDLLAAHHAHASRAQSLLAFKS